MIQMSDLPKRTADFIGKVSKFRWFRHRLNLRIQEMRASAHSYYIGVLFLISQIQYGLRRKHLKRK